MGAMFPYESQCPLAATSRGSETRWAERLALLISGSADVVIRVTYLRDDKRWSANQRLTHRMVQCRKAITPSSAKNQASAGETLSCKPKLAS